MAEGIKYTLHEGTGLDATSAAAQDVMAPPKPRPASETTMLDDVVTGAKSLLNNEAPAAYAVLKGQASGINVEFIGTKPFNDNGHGTATGGDITINKVVIGDKVIDIDKITASFEKKDGISVLTAESQKNLDNNVQKGLEIVPVKVHPAMSPEEYARGMKKDDGSKPVEAPPSGVQTGVPHAKQQPVSGKAPAATR